MKKVIYLLLVAFVIFTVWQGLKPKLSGLGPTIFPPKPTNVSLSGNKIIDTINSTGMPLKLPAGFKINIFSRDVPGARVMLFDKSNQIVVSLIGAGKVVRLKDLDNDGVVDQSELILQGLKNPHGLVFWGDRLVVAEEQRVMSYIYEKRATITNGEKIMDLSGPGGHFTRTLGVGPDGKLYVSIGSSCNVCRENDMRRAAIMVVEPEGKSRVFASGLRNSVFFTWQPQTGEMWATDNGRDRIGDDIPPDEINIIKEGKFYGWPFCYGKNVWDQTFDSSTEAQAHCQSAEPAYVDLQAHSAALGLAFVPANSKWPVEYRNNLLVAYHGSWNRSIPTGYKIVRVKLDDKGKYLGTEDFISGWLPDPPNGEQVYGRPVGLTFGPDGALYISDDKIGVIYRVVYQ